MKNRITMSLLLLNAAGTLCLAQAVPTAVAVAPENPSFPQLDGVIHYALSASEIIQFDYDGSSGVGGTTALSGNVSYQGKSQSLPFSLLIASGLLFGNGSGQGVSTYDNVAISQGLVTRKWILNVSDSFSFLPQSPTTGPSGIAGVGDLGTVPISGPTEGPAGGVLSYSADRFSNGLSGSAERMLDHATSVSGVGSWSVLHFLDDNAGLDNGQITGAVSLNRRLNARSSGSVNATYSTIYYNQTSGLIGSFQEPDIEIRGLNASYQRTLSRGLSMGVSAGPQWVSSSNSALVPSRLNLAATASLSYQHRYTTASVAYSRGVNGGSGVIPGALSDTISGGVGRSYKRDWVFSASAGWVRTSGLTELATANATPVNAVFYTEYAGAQVTRRIASNLSAYASYTVQNQSYNNAFPVQNALNGLSQSVGIGITYTPRSTRLGQF